MIEELLLMIIHLFCKLIEMIIQMKLFQSFPFVFLLLIPSTIVLAQTTSVYTAYQTSFPFVTTCSTNQYFDVASLQCSNCPANAQPKKNGNFERKQFINLIIRIAR